MILPIQFSWGEQFWPSMNILEVSYEQIWLF